MKSYYKNDPLRMRKKEKAVFSMPNHTVIHPSKKKKKAQNY